MNIIEDIRKKNGKVNAVFYGRFSSDMQREESIDAQLRAVKEYALKNDICLVGEYADRALSGKYDTRPEFQRMINDAYERQFDLVLVHKLDRFARNRADNAIYKRELLKNDVRLVSVLENFDDSPEAVILESVIEGYNEYYSRNLAREVMKGMKENALKGRHCGGTPPLGYDVDIITKKFVVNEFEAQAVRLIFQRYIEGNGYGKIVEELNKKGYVTKKKKTFSTNSIHDILQNEKYTGVYIYNRCVARDVNGKRNRHKYKPDDEIIKIENAFPSLISKSTFSEVQKIMQNRKHTISNRAVETYLLTGKIVCGVCNGHYVGSRKIVNDKKYILYECNIRHRHAGITCNNKCVNRDEVEDFVIRSIKNFLTNDNILKCIEKYSEEYIIKQKKKSSEEIKNISKQIRKIDTELRRISDVITKVNSETLIDNLLDLEQRKKALIYQSEQLSKSKFDKDDIKELFLMANKLSSSSNSEVLKRLIDIFIDKIVINPDDIKIIFKYDFRFLDYKIISG